MTSVNEEEQMVEEVIEMINKDISSADKQIMLLTNRKRDIDTRLCRANRDKRMHSSESYKIQLTITENMIKMYNEYILKKWELLATIELLRRE